MSFFLASLFLERATRGMNLGSYLFYFFLRMAPIVLVEAECKLNICSAATVLDF